MNQCRICSKTLEVPINLINLLSLTSLSQSTMCKSCSNKFSKIVPQTSCVTCSKPLADHSHCTDCLKWKDIYPHMVISHESIYQYNSFAKEWMKQFKFTGDVYVGESMNKVLKNKITPYLKTNIVVPIPSSEKSLEERGFNQLEVLLDFAKIPFTKLLTHIGKSTRQAEKNREERLDTTQPFIVNERYQNKVNDKEILLIDDVYTTGRTLYHARECLSKAGLDKVNSITLFR